MFQDIASPGAPGQVVAPCLVLGSFGTWRACFHAPIRATKGRRLCTRLMNMSQRGAHGLRDRASQGPTVSCALDLSTNPSQ